jgi:hypothetical protein
VCAGNRYPTPFLGRNELVHAIDVELKAQGVLSRGRFGGWKYEVANQVSTRFCLLFTKTCLF